MSKSTKSSKFIKMSKCNDSVQTIFLTFYGQTFILIKFQKNPPIDFGKERFLQVFTIYGHGSHTGHVTKLICINFHSFQFI